MKLQRHEKILQTPFLMCWKEQNETPVVWIRVLQVSIRGLFVDKRNWLKPYQVEKAHQMIYALMWQLPEHWVYEPVSLNIQLMWQNVSIPSFLVSNSVFYFVKTLYCMAYIAFFMIKLYAIKGTKWNQQFQIVSFIYERENKMKLIVSNRVFYRRKREQNETNGFIQGLLEW